jgi:c-di-GMP-binding flagellar brake protein YcgR
MPGKAQLRVAPRYHIALPVSYCTEEKGSAAAQKGSGSTRNLSDTGACLELAEGLAPKTRLSVTLHDDAENLSLEAEVIWVGHPPLPTGATLHGVAFQRMTPTHRQALEELIQRRGRARSRGTRLPAALPTVCRPFGLTGEPVRGWTGDLSWEGCLLLLPDRFPVGTLIEVTLTTSRGDFTAKATVVWVDPTERAVTRQLARHGVRFVEVNWTEDNVLDAIFDRIPTEGSHKPHVE